MIDIEGLLIPGPDAHLLSRMLLSMATLEAAKNVSTCVKQSPLHRPQENLVLHRGICWQNERIASGVEGCLKQNTVAEDQSAFAFAPHILPLFG